MLIKAIVKAMLEGKSFEDSVKKYQFDEMQKVEIKEGLETLSLREVESYAKKEINWLQMAEIRHAYEDGLTVLAFSVAKKYGELDWLQMAENMISYPLRIFVGPQV